MTDVTISGLPAAGSLTGIELVPVVQGGVTSRTTIGAISDLLLGTYIDARNYAIDPTGVNDSSVGGNLAIADAIAQKKKLIWPCGLFLLNAPLLAFTGINETFQMYGQGGAAASSHNGTPVSPLPHPDTYVANTVFYTNFTNAPAVVVSSGRWMVLKDFAILGQNMAPRTAAARATGPSNAQADYISPGCQNGRYAPYCGIAFDPFSNSTAQTVTGVTKAASAVVTVSTGASNPFVIGQQIVFAGVAGMTQINGLNGTVAAVGGVLGAWTATVNINSTSFSSYVNGGTAVGLPCNIGAITNIQSSGSSTVVTLGNPSLVHPLQCGEHVVFAAVSGMTQINGQTGMVTGTAGTGPGAWTFTVNINSAAFSPYLSGGQVVASDAYSSLSQYYQAGAANDGTYGCVVENVNVDGFVVGIAIGLSGNLALAADITFRNVNVSDCDVCYAIGQGESRNLNIEYGNFGDARTGIDGINYGRQNGTPPQLLRVNLGFLYRIFALSQSVGNCVVDNCYAESIVCIGQYGFGSASSSAPLTFIGGDFTFGDQGWLQAPLLLETYGPTTFRGTSLGFVTAPGAEIDALNFVMPSHPLLFDHCEFGGTSVANVPSHVGLTLDAGTGGYTKFIDCWMNGSTSFTISNDMGRTFGVASFNTSSGRLAAVYQTYRVANGNTEYVYLPYSSQPCILVSGVSALALSGSTVTFNCSNALQLCKGDILFWGLLAQGYSLLKWIVPALQITNITGMSVTCRTLFDPAQYDSVAHQFSTSQVAVAPNHWAPTRPLTCVTSGTTTLTNVSPSTILQNGDFVAGSGIPANSRVVSGGGTATVVISQTVTSSASGVELYFGRLYAPTLIPLT